MVIFALDMTFGCFVALFFVVYHGCFSLCNTGCFQDEYMLSEALSLRVFHLITGGHYCRDGSGAPVDIRRPGQQHSYFFGRAMKSKTASSRKSHQYSTMVDHVSKGGPMAAFGMYGITQHLFNGGVFRMNTSCRKPCRYKVCTVFQGHYCRDVGGAPVATIWPTCAW